MQWGTKTDHLLLSHLDLQQWRDRMWQGHKLGLSMCQERSGHFDFCFPCRLSLKPFLIWAWSSICLHNMNYSMRSLGRKIGECSSKTSKWQQGREERDISATTDVLSSLKQGINLYNSGLQTFGRKKKKHWTISFYLLSMLKKNESFLSSTKRQLDLTVHYKHLAHLL